MIFVTIGTSEPFDRLLRALDRLPGDEALVVQHGSSSVRPTDATCIDFLSFDELVEHVRQARVVVTHAGVGSVMAAVANGKRPIVVPRLHRFGEAVDDHQVGLGRRLAQAGLVTLVEDPDRLADAVAGSSVDAPASMNGGDSLADELRSYLTARLGPRPSPLPAP